MEIRPIRKTIPGLRFASSGLLARRFSCEAAVDLLAGAAVVESQPMDGRSGVADAHTRYGGANGAARSRMIAKTN